MIAQGGGCASTGSRATAARIVHFQLIVAIDSGSASFCRANEPLIIKLSNPTLIAGQVEFMVSRRRKEIGWRAVDGIPVDTLTRWGHSNSRLVSEPR